MSKRGQAWKKFAEKVYEHIELYTVPQYGDEGDDLITGYTAEKCIECVNKYAKRFGSNQREGQELLDMMKIAHYAQCAYDKIGDSDKASDREVFLGDPSIAIEDIDRYISQKKMWDRNVKITVEFV